MSAKAVKSFYRVSIILCWRQTSQTDSIRLTELKNLYSSWIQLTFLYLLIELLFGLLIGDLLHKGITWGTDLVGTYLYNNLFSVLMATPSITLICCKLTTLMFFCLFMASSTHGGLIWIRGIKLSFTCFNGCTYQTHHFTIGRPSPSNARYLY